MGNKLDSEDVWIRKQKVAKENEENFWRKPRCFNISSFDEDDDDDDDDDDDQNEVQYLAVWLTFRNLASHI